MKCPICTQIHDNYDFVLKKVQIPIRQTLIDVIGLRVQNEGQRVKNCDHKLML